MSLYILCMHVQVSRIPRIYAESTDMYGFWFGFFPIALQKHLQWFEFLPQQKEVPVWQMKTSTSL